MKQSTLSGLWCCRILPACIVFSFVIITQKGQIFGEELPTGESRFFSGSGNCELCHAPNPPNRSAMTDRAGTDISPITLWRSSVMAQAAKDPFWQAKVSAEVSEYPQWKFMIENKCISCHGPIGQSEAIRFGPANYGTQDLQSSPLAMEGVGCTVCHQIQDRQIAGEPGFSGNYYIDGSRKIYGPHQAPFSHPMERHVNYLPTYSAHIMRSELCATCHTLFTPILDSRGVGKGKMPEQVPYLEWKNSSFPSQNIECQNCHFENSEEPMSIASRPPFLQPRLPYAKHLLVGGNVFLLNLLRSNADGLGLSAEPDHFRQTLNKTLEMLQKEAVVLEANARWTNENILDITVTVKNQAGHKFPTGFPSRRSWIVLTVKNEGGQAIFESGAWDKAKGEIVGLDESYEPHYDVIFQPDQVQIYESIMKDSNHNTTYSLIGAAGYQKDNRIPPKGFSAAAPGYEYVAIHGQAAEDSNFNLEGTKQGTGADRVTYRIGNLTPQMSYIVEIKLLYQTITPRFAGDLFSHKTALTDKFKHYYDLTDRRPVLIDSVVFSSRKKS
jgi:hypothetical protein